MGADLGVYDIEVVWRLSGVQICAAWTKFEAYVGQIQLSRNDVYKEFTLLASDRTTVYEAGLRP